MPSIKCNLHTHTQFCDGKDSMEDMVLAAIDKGFETLGFSPHSYTPFCLDYCVRDFSAVEREFARLKGKYGEKINLLLGVELDYYGEMPKGVNLDFVIGSVHYVRGADGDLYAVDESPEDFALAVENGFGGDKLLLAEKYFETLARMIREVSPDIIGHFDIIDLYGKYEPAGGYKSAALAACDAARKSGALVEINTGRLFKGKGGLYPDDFIIKQLSENGAGLILSSDAHQKEALGYEFDSTVLKLKTLGVRRLAVYGKNGRTFTEI